MVESSAVEAYEPPPIITAADLQAVTDCLGWTQTDLAEAVGQDRAAISRYITGKRYVPRPNLWALALSAIYAQNGRQSKARELYRRAVPMYESKEGDS